MSRRVCRENAYVKYFAVMTLTCHNEIVFQDVIALHYSIWGKIFLCRSNYMSQYYCIYVRVRLTGTGWNIGHKALCYFTDVSARLTGTGSGAPSVTTIAARRHIRNSVDTERASTQTASRRDR